MKANHKYSILQGDIKRCYVTEAENVPLHKHHIYAGSNRKTSDKYGFWVWLTPYWHNGSDFGVHGIYGKELDLQLKQACQRKYEEKHTREQFLKLIGRNYLDD